MVLRSFLAAYVEWRLVFEVNLDSGLAHHVLTMLTGSGSGFEERVDKCSWANKGMQSHASTSMAPPVRENSVCIHVRLSHLNSSTACQQLPHLNPDLKV